MILNIHVTGRNINLRGWHKIDCGVIKLCTNISCVQYIMHTHLVRMCTQRTLCPGTCTCSWAVVVHVHVVVLNNIQCISILHAGCLWQEIGTNVSVINVRFVTLFPMVSHCGIICDVGVALHWRMPILKTPVCSRCIILVYAYLYSHIYYNMYKYMYVPLCKYMCMKV